MPYYITIPLLILACLAVCRLIELGTEWRKAMRDRGVPPINGQQWQVGGESWPRIEVMMVRYNLDGKPESVTYEQRCRKRFSNVVAKTVSAKEFEELKRTLCLHLRHGKRA